MRCLVIDSSTKDVQNKWLTTIISYNRFWITCHEDSGFFTITSPILILFIGTKKVIVHWSCPGFVVKPINCCLMPIMPFTQSFSYHRSNVKEQQDKLHCTNQRRNTNTHSNSLTCLLKFSHTRLSNLRGFGHEVLEGWVNVRAYGNILEIVLFAIKSIQEQTLFCFKDLKQCSPVQAFEWGIFIMQWP